MQNDSNVLWKTKLDRLGAALDIDQASMARIKEVVALEMSSERMSMVKQVDFYFRERGWYVSPPNIEGVTKFIRVIKNYAMDSSKDNKL